MNINMANRECCDLEIKNYATKKPWMFADFCNTTTAGFTGESSYAMKKGAKALAFHNPIEGTMTLEFQVHPFKVYSLLSDGEISSNGIITKRQTVNCTEDGKLTVEGTPKEGTLFVYSENDYGGTEIAGTLASNKFTATNAGEIVSGKTYIVSFLEEKTTGIKRIQFNNNKVPKSYYIEMQTVDKNENDELIPIKIIGYKATPKRNLELSFSSQGDPASIKIEFACMADKDDNVLDIIEIEE